MKTKLIALLLLASMVFAVFVGCKNNTSENGGGTESNPINGNSGDEYADNLPDDLDFGGQTIKIHHMTPEDVYLDDQTDIVNSKIYNRKLAVEDRLKVEIEPYLPYNWTQYSMAIQEIRLSIALGADDFQLIAGWSAQIPALSMEGLFMNFHDPSMSYVDLKQPYWVQSLVEDLTIGDKLFFVTGDAALTTLGHAYVVGVNKDLVNDYIVPDLVSIVKEGKWTIEKMGEIAKMVSGGPDGDTIGLLIDNEIRDIADCFMQGSNISLVSRDEENLPYLDADTDKLTTLTNKVYDLFFETDGVKVITTTFGYNTLFPEGKAMLYPSYLKWYTSFYREMENKSVLPWPKYDEAQTEYYTRVQNGVSLWSVPTTVVTTGEDISSGGREDRLEAATATLEALGSYSYKYVTPTFFEEALKVKYNDDPDAYEMLDIARKGIIMNFEIIYTNNIGGAWNVLRDLMYEKDNDFASLWEQRGPVVEQRIIDLIDIFNSIE